MHKIRLFVIRFLVVLLAFQGAIAAQLISLSSVQADDSLPEVVINEVMWMGSTGSSADEWIELRNTTEGPIDLTNWTLTHSASGGADLTINAGVIPANGLFLISNFSQTDANSVLDVPADLVTTSLALANTCSQIDLVSSELTVVDSMGCDNGNYFYPASSSTNDALERNLVITDGLIASSWHERTDGWANLDDAAVPANLATPKLVNDLTMPTNGVVVDEGQFSADLTSLNASWSAFSDGESSVASYQVGVGTAPDLNDIAGPVTENTTSHSFNGLSLVENQTYYINVAATNSVHLTGTMASSDGITVNTLAPETPTNLTVIDNPNDGGGRLKASWTASTSPDVTSYQLNYRQLGEVVWTSVNVGLVSEAVISDLANAPVTYELTVEAIDFNAQHSPTSSTVTAQATDNVAPLIDQSKIRLTQNAPGTSDKVEGLVGVSSEAGQASVYDRDPADPAALLIGSMSIAPDLGFLPIFIGDNQYSAVWLQLMDAAGNKSVLKLTNDIVSPNAPTLTNLEATCFEECQVELKWQDNGPDTLAYQVGYSLNGVEQLSLKVTVPMATLTLPAGSGYDFVVYAIDAAGNRSSSSNVFGAQLTSGVRTIVKLIDGQPLTETSALSGTQEAIVTPLPRFFTPSTVDAAEPAPVVENSGKNQGDDANADVAGQNNNAPSWMKVLAVVVLLLVVAGGFYLLSRSFDDEPEKSKPASKAPVAAKKTKTTPKKKTAPRKARKS